MKIRFIGAVGTVTGSCTLLEHQGEFFLVDCGGGQDAVADASTPLDFKPCQLRSIFLTHAHLDHCGLIPALIAQGFRGNIHCTAATRDLTINSLNDSVHLGQVRQCHVPTEDRFTCLDNHPEFVWGKYMPATADLTYALARNSHILGSASVSFQFPDIKAPSGRTTICFSGDVGCNHEGNLSQALLAKRYTPDSYATYLVLESTYGDRNRDPDSVPFESRMVALKSVCMRALVLGSQPLILIPCFTLHRVQELMADLHCLANHFLDENSKQEWSARMGRDDDDPLIDIAVESPLAWNHTETYRRELVRMLNTKKCKPLYLNGEFESRCCSQDEHVVDVIEDLFKEPSHGQNTIGDLRIGKDANFLSDNSIRIVIAGSGMCLGGRILEHLKEHLSDPEVLVVLMGFQASGTPGAELRKRINDPAAALNLKSWDLPAEVKATIMDLGRFYSGHADQASLVKFALEKDAPQLRYSPLRRVFLNHGEDKSREALKKALQGYASKNPSTSRVLESVELPVRGGGWFDLIQNKWTEECEIRIDSPDSLIETLSRKVNRLDAEVNRLKAAA